MVSWLEVVDKGLICLVYNWEGVIFSYTSFQRTYSLYKHEQKEDTSKYSCYFFHLKMQIFSGVQWYV